MSAPQKAQVVQVPAKVISFATEMTDSQERRYPAALLVTASADPGAAAPSKPRKELGGHDDATDVQEGVTSAFTLSDGVPPSGPRDFSTGICDFPMSWAICADAYCCMYCTASTHHNFLLNEEKGMNIPVCFGLCCIDVGLANTIAPVSAAICFHTCFMRHMIRQRYNLYSEVQSAGPYQGDLLFNMETLKDVLTVCCCLSCTIAQHQREIMMQGEWCGGIFSNQHSLEVPGAVHTV